MRSRSAKLSRSPRKVTRKVAPGGPGTLLPVNPQTSRAYVTRWGWTIPAGGHNAHQDSCATLFRWAVRWGSEHRLYNAYNDLLSFNAIRTILPDPYRVSIWPQPELNIKAVSHDFDAYQPDDKGETRAKQGDVEKNAHSKQNVLAMIDSFGRSTRNANGSMGLRPTQRGNDRFARLDQAKASAGTTGRGAVRAPSQAGAPSGGEKPGSSSSVASQSSPKAIQRYPDFAVLITKLNPDGLPPAGISHPADGVLDEVLQCIVEIKAASIRSDPSGSSFSMKAAVDAARVQLLEQGKCAFSQYPRLSLLHVFFAVADMVVHFYFERSHMPSSFSSIATTPASQLLPYFKQETKQPFQMLGVSRTGNYDYTTAFKKFWEAATRSAFLDLVRNLPGHAGGATTNTGGNTAITGQADNDDGGRAQDIRGAGHSATELDVQDHADGLDNDAESDADADQDSESELSYLTVTDDGSEAAVEGGADVNAAI